MNKRRSRDPHCSEKRGLPPDVLFQQIKTDLKQRVAAYLKRLRKQRAANIKRDVEACADELRRSGAHNPVEQAEDEAAPRWGHKNGPALNRWVRRNLDQDKNKKILSVHKSRLML